LVNGSKVEVRVTANTSSGFKEDAIPFSVEFRNDCVGAEITGGSPLDDM